MSSSIEVSRPSFEPGVPFTSSLAQRLESLQAPRRNRLMREIASQLALLTPYLEPCYRKSGADSFVSASAALDSRDESAHRIHEGLSLVGDWFYRWRGRLARLPESLKLAELVGLVEELDRVLRLTSLFAAEFAERATEWDLDGSDRRRFAGVVARYNRFLADFERLWGPAAERSPGIEWPALPAEPHYERVGVLEGLGAH